MSLDYDIRAFITLPGGGVIHLDEAPYDFEKSHQETEQQSLRKTTVNNRWVEGTFTISAVRDNVREPLSVYVEGADAAAFDVAMQVLKDAVASLRWTLTVRIYEGGVEKVQRVYACQASEYTITTTQEYRVANMGLFKADVDRLPHVAVTYP